MPETNGLPIQRPLGTRWNPFREDSEGADNPAHDAWATCSYCGRIWLFSEMSGWYCGTDCEYAAEYGDNADEEETVSVQYREYSRKNLPAFQSRGRGKYIKSGRIFSAEIECYFDGNESLRTLRHLQDGVGITDDGSLGNKGIEIVTPKLKGAQGEKALRHICAVLNEAQCRVDRSTGLHVHLDGRGFLPRTRSSVEPKALKQLWYFYHTFDSVIMSFLPRSRRMNQYCRSVKGTATAERIEGIRTLRQAEELWYKTEGERSLRYEKQHHYSTTRYSGLNLHCLFTEKHIEIRFHGGTLNGVKILNWVALHQRILDLAAAKELPTEKVKNENATLEEATATFFQLLNLPLKAQKYFLQRQKTFAGQASPASEDGAGESITDENESITSESATVEVAHA